MIGDCTCRPAFAGPSQYSRHDLSAHNPTTNDVSIEKDDIAARTEAFDQANGGGVGWYKDKAPYHLYLLATEAPIARLKPTGTGDEVRIASWSHRRKWEDIDNMGGCVLPIDPALGHIATNSLFWTWA